MKTLARKTLVYLEMIKFEHSIFALPFAYLGLFLAAGGFPELSVFAWTTAAMVTFRSMAMGANRLIDREVDRLNPRTASRALPAGSLSVKWVWTVTLLFLGLFLASAAVLGPRCFYLTPIPIFLAWLYPFAKRFTWLSHWILGIILGIAPYGAWIAAGKDFSWTPGFLTVGVTFWVAGFDIIYALQDLEFDKKQRLYSFPSHFGERKSLFMAISLHIAAWFSWIAAGYSARLSWLFFGGMLFIAFLLAREIWLVRRFGLKKIHEAFFVTNAAVSISLFGFVVLDLLRH